MTDLTNKVGAEQAPARIGVLVLGMHRSGTSALAGLLHRLGCDLPSHLLPAASGNDLGHWESETIMALNDQILVSAGSCWNDWSPVNADWYKSPFYASFLQAAREALRTEYGSSPLFVLKDPRICRLAPLWLEALDLENIAARVVLPVRNPLEVSASLQTRDGIESAYGQLLWLRHVLDAEYSSRGRRRIFCTYNQLLNDRPALIKSLAAKFDLTWPRYTAANRASIAAFLSDKNRHHEEREESVLADPTLSRWLRDGYATLLRWSEGDEKSEDYATLDAILREFDAASDAFAPILVPGYRSHSATAESERVHLQTELAAAQSRADAAEASFREIQAQIAEAHGREAELSARLTHLLPEFEASQIGSSEALEQLAVNELRSRETINRLTNELESVHSRLEKARGEAAELTHRLATAESTLQQRLEEIDQTRQALELASQQAHDRTAEAEKLRNRLADADSWVFKLAGDRHAAEMSAEAARRDSAAALHSMRSAEQARDELLARLERIESKPKRVQSDGPSSFGIGSAEQEAEIQKLTAEVDAQKAANGRLVHELAAIKDKATSAAAALDERFREIAVLTRLLRSSEVQSDQASSQVEWLRQVNTALITSPRWWSFLPKSWTRKREFRRLRSRGLFDAEHYLTLHPDVLAEGMDPLRHYILHGMAEGRER